MKKCEIGKFGGPEALVAPHQCKGDALCIGRGTETKLFSPVIAKMQTYYVCNGLSIMNLVCVGMIQDADISGFLIVGTPPEIL